MDQENEYKQMTIEEEISKTFQNLYDLLQVSDRVEAEEALGHIAQAKEIWDK